jgi:hypothetical protein
MEQQRFDYLKQEALEGNNLSHFEDAHDNFELMKIVVENNPNNAYYASASLKDNGDFIKITKSLIYASERLKSDPEFVKDLLKINYENFGRISLEFRNNVDMAKAAIEGTQFDGTLFYMVLNVSAPMVRSDESFAKYCIEHSSLFNKSGTVSFYSYFSKEIRENREIAKSMLIKDGKALEYCGEIICSDKECVLLATEQNPFAIRYASDEFKNDFDIVKPLYVREPLVFGDMGDILKQNSDIIQFCIEKNPFVFQSIPLEHRFNVNNLLVLLKRDFLSFTEYTAWWKSPDEIISSTHSLKNLLKKIPQDELLFSFIRHSKRKTSENHFFGFGFDLLMSSLDSQSLKKIKRECPHWLSSSLFKKAFDQQMERTLILEVSINSKLNTKTKKNRKLHI